MKSHREEFYLLPAERFNGALESIRYRFFQGELTDGSIPPPLLPYLLLPHPNVDVGRGFLLFAAAGECSVSGTRRRGIPQPRLRLTIAPSGTLAYANFYRYRIFSGFSIVSHPESRGKWVLLYSLCANFTSLGRLCRRPLTPQTVRSKIIQSSEIADYELYKSSVGFSVEF